MKENGSRLIDKKKGFTLTELLAVIVILAIIALIAIPLIGTVIEKAKIGSLESSVNGLVESANMYYANNTIKGETITETIFDFEEGIQTGTKKLEYKGKVYNGKLILHTNGNVAVCIDDNKYYAYKNKDTDEIVSGVGTCLYDGTTGDFSSNGEITDLRGKTLIATTLKESEDGLNALITIPEEGHYDETSTISVPIETIKNEVDSSYTLSSSYGTTASSVLYANTEIKLNKGDILCIASGQGNGGPISISSFNVTGNVQSFEQYGKAGVTSTQQSWENSTRVIVFVALEDNCIISNKSSLGSSSWTGMAYVILTQ